MNYPQQFNKWVSLKVSQCKTNFPFANILSKMRNKVIDNGRLFEAIAGISLTGSFPLFSVKRTIENECSVVLKASHCIYWKYFISRKMLRSSD